MKIDRRGFLGASILAAIPRAAVAGSVFEEKPELLVHKWNPPQTPVELKRVIWPSLVSCEILMDPKISVSHWGLPEYEIEAKIASDDSDRWFFRLPFYRVIENEIVFRDRSGKELEISRSKHSRILLASCRWIGNRNVHAFFRFQEVPAVIFKDKNQTAEEVFGVGRFPGFGE